MIERARLRPLLLRLNPAVDLHWRHWEPDWVVFDVASGNTHQMNGLAACVLLCLEAGPLDAEALVAEIEAATSLSEESIRPALLGVIGQLTRLDMVDTVPE